MYQYTTFVNANLLELWLRKGTFDEEVTADLAAQIRAAGRACKLCCWIHIT
jgi:hypothetical protein